MPVKSEAFIVCYDSSDVEDMSCLTVSKVVDSRLVVTNIFYKDEADSLYNKLNVVQSSQK